MMHPALRIGILSVAGGVALWLLPTAVDSWTMVLLIGGAIVTSLVFGAARQDWRFALVIGTFLVLTDMFGLVRSAPNALWLVMAAVWIGGTWLIGHVGDAQQRLFHQGLASFLVLELFLTLQLWPINIVSKSVIVVAFVFFLWHEFVRSVPAAKRIRESVLPFALVVLLMTLTGQWLTF